jgi:pimeloyl-CoA dehydrogenase
MDLRFTPEEVAFREEVRTFIRDNLPRAIRERMRLGYPPRTRDTSDWHEVRD